MGQSIISEPKRGCGFRKIGGLYMMTAGEGYACEAMPYHLHVCPMCKAGIKFQRGWQWIQREYFADACDIPDDCELKFKCPFTEHYDEKFRFDSELGLMWVGKQFYTPDSFIREANELGISKRIAAIPNGFELNKTWLLFAHVEACRCPECDIEDECEVCCGAGYVPGIFYACRPSKIEKLLNKEMYNELTDEQIESYEKRGIDLVVFDDSDLVDDDDLKNA